MTRSNDAASADAATVGPSSAANVGASEATGATGAGTAGATEPARDERAPRYAGRLRRSDPPALGPVVLNGRIAADDAGVLFAGRLPGPASSDAPGDAAAGPGSGNGSGGRPVVVAMLTEGAESDPYGRARFLAAVAASGAVLASDADADIAPWAAVGGASADERQTAATALLAPVTMAHVAPAGEPRGPGFRPHWTERLGAGRWRVWPLPWPTALTKGALWTHLAALALVLLIAAIALFIAVKIFEDRPLAPPPRPVVPTTGPGTGPTDGPTEPGGPSGTEPTPPDGTEPDGSQGIPPTV